MAEKKILFKRGTSDKLPASKLANALYFVTDKGQLYLGDTLIADKTGNYADAINNAIAALDETVKDESGLVKVTVVEEDGKLTSITVNQDSLLQEFEKYQLAGDYKTKQTIVEDPKASGDSLTFIDSISQNENGEITVTKKNIEGFDEYKNNVDTLIGKDANKSVRAIANEELAAQLIPEEAKEALDTLTEIAAWIQDHPDDVADMNAAINAIKAEIGGTFESGVGFTNSRIDSLESSKADKVSGAVAGNFASLDENGNLSDSGKTADDFATSTQGATADTALQSVSILNKTLTKTQNSISVEEAKNALGLGSAAYTDSNAYDAKDTAKTLIGTQISEDGKTAATGIYALIQGATRNTVKDCVDSINALTTQLEWDSF